MGKTIWLIEAFFSGSHRMWVEGYKKHSKHRIEIFSLPGRHWKWRMEGAAVHFAQLLNERTDLPDFILTTDMLDLAAFKGLLKEELSAVPAVLYFHENQFAYPISKNEVREEFHYAWKNFTSALSADKLIFNSNYNKDSFFSGLRELLDRLPDHSPKNLVHLLEQASSVIPVGLELPQIERSEKNPEAPPVILWNHRWEHDKGPEAFFRMLFKLQEEDFLFQLIVLGEKYKNSPPIFDEAEERLRKEIIHWGYAPDRDAYWSTLGMADILPVTSLHDFFGISVAEAVHAGVRPLLPKDLAYPELLDPVIFPHCFYSDLEELGNAVKESRNNPIPAMDRFSWTEIAPLLDAQFSID